MMLETKKKIRISLDLSARDFERLRRLEHLTGSDSKVDVLRDALRLYEFLVKESLRGSKLKSEGLSGEIRELFVSSLPTPDEPEGSEQLDRKLP
jgi:hypothetical protein